MSEEEFELKFKEAQEKIRLNAITHLKDLGYAGETGELTIDQVEARIELLKEEKINADKEKPKLEPKLTGIDGFKENIKKLTGKEPKEGEEPDLENYDALEAYISQLAPDERLNTFHGARVIRLLKPIQIGDKTIMRRLLI